MTDDTTTLLRRALTFRHSPPARAFFAALLGALAAGTDDGEEVRRVVERGVTERVGAASVSEWLRGLVAGTAIDERRVVAAAAEVEAALREVALPTFALSERRRTRLREAMASG